MSSFESFCQSPRICSVQTSKYIQRRSSALRSIANVGRTFFLPRVLTEWNSAESGQLLVRCFIWWCVGWVVGVITTTTITTTAAAAAAVFVVREINNVSQFTVLGANRILSVLTGADVPCNTEIASTSVRQKGHFNQPEGPLVFFGAVLTQTVSTIHNYMYTIYITYITVLYFRC